MEIIPWQIGSWNIPFHLGHDCAPEIADRLAAQGADRYLVIADATAWKLHASRYAALNRLPNLTTLTWSGSEANKTLTEVHALCGQLISARATRRSLIIAAGGGLLGNIAGFAASILFRGIRFVHLPTTLLAMHDSVTSLKQGVNCDGIKNILGAYHAPTAILVDTAFLSTLPQAHIRSGLVELVKDTLISKEPIDITSGDWPALIRTGVRVKSTLMRDDPHERGKALALEYGHTFGHAIELACNGELNHGDSIAWGMKCAAWVAADLGLLSPTALARHDEILLRLGPLPRPTRPMTELARRIHQDNKRGYLAATSGAAMVLLRGIGHVAGTPDGIPLSLVPDEAIDRGLNRLIKAWTL